MSGLGRTGQPEQWQAACDAPDGALPEGDTRSHLIEIWQRARAAWPSVALSAETFLSYLARHLPADPPTAEALAQINTGDLYLACGCAMGDPHALAAFEEHYLSSFDRVLARLRFTPDVIAEVKQRIRCRALVAVSGRPRIVDYGGRGALRTWVRVMGLREALRVTRKAHRETAVDDTEKLQVFLVRENPALESVNAGYRRTFAQAFDRALRELSDRDRIMLRQHILDGLSIDKLGVLYGVHRATAARMLERARRSVLAATRAHMREQLDMSSTELSSVLRAIRSRLEVTLRRLRRDRR